MVIGHKRQKNILEKICVAGRVPHTLIFIGPEHLGKKLIAQEFCNLLLFGKQKMHNENRVQADIMLCGEDGTLTMKTVRQMRRFVQLSPLQADKKCLIVDNAHNLGRAGTNALLKTLEEPSPKTHIILITSRPEKLPRTVHSRAMKLQFFHVPDDVILSSIPLKKRPTLQKELEWIAGRPGLLLMLLKDKKQNEVHTRRKYYKMYDKLYNTVTLAPRIQMAETITKDVQAQYALEALIIAARKKLLESSPEKWKPHIKAIQKLKEAQEWVLFSNTNTRLSLEYGLLPHPRSKVGRRQSTKSV